MPVVEHLRLGYHFVEYLYAGTMPTELSASLSCLKVLELPSICFRCMSEISVVLCLIVSSPNLEKLEIVFVATSGKIIPLAPKLLKVADLLENALKKLRVVKMKLSDKKEVRPELEFLKFLLAESVVLEKMLIQPAEGTTAEEGFKILKKIIRFQRSSKKADILYLDCDGDGEC
ncbi:uncharacterized protein LOC126671318 [Mercurialis annua]|uniref:uncharacterized protein LOC126671318 n=1 Tax=Mercurialis annua TaxID=3986 RepID=UPI00215F14FB|nr:uncharacterized protein LOC126671318 [Mercurialis annua]